MTQDTSKPSYQGWQTHRLSNDLVEVQVAPMRVRSAYRAPSHVESRQIARISTPYLVERRGEKVCSACAQIFQSVDGESIGRAFAAYIAEKHQAQPEPTKK